MTRPYSLPYTANSILSAMEINLMNIIGVSVFVSVAIIVVLLLLLLLLLL